MLITEHVIFAIKLIIANLISDVPGWVEDGQKGIKQFRLKRKLERAFAFNEEDDIGMEIGVIAGEVGRGVHVGLVRCALHLRVGVVGCAQARAAAR
jgi:hypothetical protein